MTHPKAGLTSFLFLLCTLLAAASAEADPRWWWHDALVATGGRISSLDIDAVEPVYRGDAPAVFIVYVDPPSVIEGRLMLAASFDGGCTFCEVTISSLFSGNTQAAIAVAPLMPTGTYSIQVLHAVGPDGEIQVAYDNRSVPLAGTPEEKCLALRDVNRNHATVQLSDQGGGSPQITVVKSDLDEPEFYGVWRQVVPPNDSEVYFARDLTGDGTGWERMGSVSAGFSPSGHAFYPQVTADLLSSGGPFGGSSVNIAWMDPGAGQVLYLRSSDQGDNFSATGDVPPGPPAVLNDFATGQASEALAMDSGTTGFASPLWHGVAWYESRNMELQLLIDAQHQTDASVAGPAWQDPDALVDRAGLEGEGGPVISVLPEHGGEPSPFFLVWTDGGPGGYDLFYRAGLLDPVRDPPIDLSRFPLGPDRPTDPVVSTNLLLTACDYDEATGDCITNRAAGRAVKAAMDDGWGYLWVAWIDDRNGREEVWFKRTDYQIEQVPDPTLSTSCPAPNAARITVEWALHAGCVRPTPERLERYLVYYGTDPGGPYLNAATPIVIDDDGALPDPVTLDIDDLASNTFYYVIVVPEDEARNLWPSDFDPSADLPASPDNEKSITTPDCSAPCDPLVFGGPTTAVSGDCEIDISWDSATGGVPPIEYEVLRNGTPVISGLSGTSWTDTAVAWSADYAYQVRAQDSCPDPGPQEAFNDETGGATCFDITPPEVPVPTLSAASPCVVRVEAVVSDTCSGPDAVADILRDGLEVATGVALPYMDTVPANGNYPYQVRGYDRAGNDALSAPNSILVDNCGPCLYRRTCAVRDTTGVFQPRDPVTDIAFTGPDGTDPYGPCPFPPGDPDPEQVLAPGSPVLIFYQAAGDAIRDLQVAKDVPAQSVRISF